MAKTVSMLEIELAEVQQQCTRAEQDGAELAMYYEAMMEEKDRKIAALQDHGTGGEAHECKDCKDYAFDLLLTRLMGLWVCWYQCVFLNTRFPPALKRDTFLLSLSPFAFYWIDSKWKRFKRLNHWNGTFDNDAYRRLQARWNSMIDRIKLV